MKSATTSIHSTLRRVLGLAAGVCLAAAGLSALTVQAEEKADENELQWETNIDAAKKRSADEGKPILVDFTGSDWCGWCIRLKDEVFSKDEFKAYAGENLVLLEIDFPRRTELPREQAVHNQQLMQQYGVRGFPTILLIDKDGEVLGRTGYRPGGPEAYVDHLKELLPAG